MSSVSVWLQTTTKVQKLHKICPGDNLWTGGLTCGCRGERQAQHLRVVSFDLHQLVQKLQTEDPEHTETRQPASLHSGWTQARFVSASLTAGFHSGLQQPGAARQDWYSELGSRPSHQPRLTPPSPPQPAGAVCSPPHTKSSAGPERQTGSESWRRTDTWVLVHCCVVVSRCCRGFCVRWAGRCATVWWCYQTSRWRRRTEADTPATHLTAPDTPEDEKQTSLTSTTNQWSPSGITEWLFLVMLNVGLIIFLTHLDAPHGAAVVQSRVQLPHVPHICNVPHIHTVVVVHTGQVFGCGVKGQSQRVGVLSTWTGS